MSERAAPLDTYYFVSNPSDVTERLAERLTEGCACPITRIEDETTLVERVNRDAASGIVFILPPDPNGVLAAIRAVAGLEQPPALYALGSTDDVHGAVLAIQAGIHAYFTIDEIDALTERLDRPAEASPECGGGHDESFSSIITRDPEMLALFRTAGVIASSSLPVLITGETGVGKELLAQSIHRASGRRGAFVAENLAGLDDTLFSDALFGHTRAAFTGATSDRAGLVERASGGTFFLDEIGDITQPSQVKLLRLLENRTYYPLGSDEMRRSDARIVLATNRNLVERAKNGDFRLDLFFRLAAFHLQIPPLRHRKHDIPLLAAHFARQIASELGTTPPRLGSGVLRLLEAYDYPGNVRELQSIVVTLVSQGRDGRLSGERLEQLTRSTLRRNASAGLPVDPVVVFSEKLPTIEEATDQLIDEALRRSDGNQSAAARLLGVSPSAVNKRLYRRRNAGRDTV